MPVTLSEAIRNGRLLKSLYWALLLYLSPPPTGLKRLRSGYCHFMFRASRAQKDLHSASGANLRSGAAAKGVVGSASTPSRISLAIGIRL